jgi:hypothetical protein
MYRRIDRADVETKQEARFVVRPSLHDREGNVCSVSLYSVVVIMCACVMYVSVFACQSVSSVMYVGRISIYVLYHTCMYRPIDRADVAAKKPPSWGGPVYMMM